VMAFVWIIYESNTIKVFTSLTLGAVVTVPLFMFQVNLVPRNLKNTFKELSGTTEFVSHNRRRIAGMTYAMREISASPFFGNGPGKSYESQITTSRTYIGEPKSRPADSELLSIAASYGFVFVLALMASTLLPWAKSFKQLINSSSVMNRPPSYIAVLLSVPLIVLYVLVFGYASSHPSLLLQYSFLISYCYIDNNR
jgi:hypothetical protein